MSRFLKFIFLASIIAFSLVNCALAQQGNYPQLDISGFKKWEYKKADVTPAKNYFSGLTQLGGYYPTFTGGPWQERLQLRIIGQLSENLAVTYDLEQQPETPDRYDVKVKYYNNELTFGDFTANFTGNEFASASKFLNGVMLTAKDGWYDVVAVPSAKLKSQTQNLTAQNGTNTKGPYNLGHGSIVEGSERIELNDVLLSRNTDYTIDYFEGKVTFNEILTEADQFKYTFEFTNILDLFFPALSKRDFFGFQSRFTIDPEEFGRPAPQPEPVINSANETLPTSGSVEPEVMEQEASGQYRLTNKPVVNFSEKLTFMGTQLRKNEDYIIRYAQGEIKLLTRFLPTTTEALVVEYQYYQTSAETETLAGIGSRGPYQFSRQNIVPESERIEVDSKLFVRDLDYTINYVKGEITFGVVIGPTSQVKASYRFNVMALPIAPPSKFPRELKIGTTYLRESAKKSAGTATSTIIESASGSEIISNNYLWYLQNRPIIPTSESGATFIIKVDGVELTPEVDYAIPTTMINPATGNIMVSPEAALAYINDLDDPTDGYGTGTILFINPLTITATSSVTVTYTYDKSIVGRYSDVGDSTRGPYYLRNIRNIVPGSETVQVWEQGSSVISTYTRNSSFDADAGATGYSINYNADNPSVTFNNELSTTKNFQIIYQYVPPRAFEGGDIAQSVYGFDGSFKIGEIFKIETAYAKSETDQVFVAETTYESFTGNSTKNYNLGSTKDIIEGSEKISVNNNLLNKDIDYFISYSSPGLITFYYITPTSLDAIAVEYKYQSQTGIVVGQSVKTDSAYKLGAETKLFGDVLTIGGSTKQIGFDFTPMGGTAIGLGSKYKEYNVKLSPGWQSFSTAYSYKENDNPVGTARDRFLRSYDNSISLGINPGDKALVDYSYRNYRTMDDLSQLVTTHSTDTLQESHSFGLTPTEWKRGVLTLTQKYDLRKTFSQSDVERDSNAFSQSTIDYQHANGSLKITDRVSVGYDYQISEPKALSLLTSTTEATREALSSHTRAIDNSYTLTTDLTFGAIDKWITRVSLLDHKGETLVKNFLSTEEVNTTKNETYHMDLVPFSQLSTSMDHNRQERSTVVVGGVNPRTERTSANTTYSPFGWLSAGWSGSQSESIPETGINFKTTGRSHTYNTNWNPISHNIFKLSSRFSLSDNLQTAPSGSFEGIATNTNTFSQNYTANVTPHPNVPINLGFTLENYKNKNDHPIAASMIDTETENKTINAGLTFTPIPPLSLGSNYNIKTTKVIKDLKVSPEARTKTIIDSRVTYQLFSWGTLVYDRQDEHNGGEVQAGSVADLNIKKVTETISLNVTLPVDNPVLSSFVFIASVKTVDYKNLNSSADDFIASLTTFEGSLNF
ncbi:MAG: hypothetical protein KJ732_01750 [Candidatus Margulisbacteria bacterium]|nr:hypothetical protein [Candidatus Margulisiibacteriota bacterium]